jgi:biopolymer transport protein ExbD
MDLNAGGKPKVRPDMNVTPLVDVVLVLLIIFMVLAPVVTKNFFVRLPPADEKDEELAQANDPSRPLVLSVRNDGSTQVNGTDIARPELPVRLERMFNARPDNVLYLDGTDDAPYGSVVSAIDLARVGKASPVVLLTKALEAGL